MVNWAVAWALGSGSIYEHMTVPLSLVYVSPQAYVGVIGDACRENFDPEVLVIQFHFQG